MGEYSPIGGERDASWFLEKIRIWGLVEVTTKDKKFLKCSARKPIGNQKGRAKRIDYVFTHALHLKRCMGNCR